MAQMTCAAALGEMEPDSPELHFQDMLASGKGLCKEDLAELLCEGSPKRIRELEAWNVNFARQDNGRINQVKAPGHSRRRCVYVDFLSTGVAISAALRNKTSRDAAIRSVDAIRSPMWARGGGRSGAWASTSSTGSAPVCVKCTSGGALPWRHDEAIQKHDRFQQ